MKTMKVFAIAAAALVMGLSSCTKENENKNASSENFEVTISFKNATTSRADGAAAVSGTTVGINDGWLCFVNLSNAITDFYTIRNTGTTTGKYIFNGDLGVTPLTLNDIPGTSSKACLIINTGTMITAPSVGDNIATYLGNNMNVQDQGVYTAVTCVGEGNLTPTADANKRAVTIPLATKVARIQIENLKFDSRITAGSVAGIFINGFYPTMKLDGTAGSLASSTDKAEYAAGIGIFATTLNGIVYDNFVGKNIATIVAPASGTWGYNLFASVTPQIIIKLTGVVVDGQTLTDDQFITVNGFKNGSTNAAIANLEGGMIYTIEAGTLVIKPEHLSVTPGVVPIKVDVKVTAVTWQETKVIPNL